MTDRPPVLGVLDLRGVTLAEMEAWCRMVLHAAGGRDVSLLFARDRSHVLAVEPHFAERLVTEYRAAP
jgi:hypothetical protein